MINLPVARQVAKTLAYSNKIPEGNGVRVLFTDFGAKSLVATRWGELPENLLPGVVINNRNGTWMGNNGGRDGTTGTVGMVAINCEHLFYDIFCPLQRLDLVGISLNFSFAVPGTNHFEANSCCPKWRARVRASIFRIAT